MQSVKTFRFFRHTAMAEGISFLVLLFIAMPLKYFANLPMAVTIVGGLHGVLFVAFMVLAWEVKGEHKKDWGWYLKAFIASLLPFGTFVMDKQWKREQAEAATKG
jgi:integral membrane protein